MRQGWAGAALVLLLGGVLCGILLPARAGEVYRWQDGRGQWHFGDPGVAAPGATVQRPVAPMSIIEPGHRPAPVYTGEASAPDGSPKRSARMYGVNPPEEKISRKRKRTKKADSRVAEAAPATDDRERHQRYCERWREKLRTSRLGLRDHEAQDAYDRECILNVHW